MSHMMGLASVIFRMLNNDSPEAHLDLWGYTYTDDAESFQWRLLDNLNRIYDIQLTRVGRRNYNTSGRVMLRCHLVPCREYDPRRQHEDGSDDEEYDALLYRGPYLLRLEIERWFIQDPLLDGHMTRHRNLSTHLSAARRT